MRAGVVARDRIAAFAVDHSLDAIADGQFLLENRLVGAHALYGSDATDDLGDGGVAIRRQEEADVADLAARVA